MATYNGARHLRAQLESIFAQSLMPVELHIGDDGSTDGTEELVRELAREAPFPVHFVRNATRLGYGQNFLEAARRCRGEWIAFSDQDDVWLPDKLARCAEALDQAQDREILIICHSGAVVDSALVPTGARIPADIRDETKGRLGHPLTWSHYGFAQLFRRELVAQIPLAPRVPTIFTDIDRYPHDVWISALGNVLGSTLHLAEDLCLYRRHDGSLTETAKGQSEGALTAARNTGAGHYRHVASICREAAAAFEVQARGTERESWRDKMIDGARAYKRLAGALELRASIYDRSLGDRLRALSGLLAGKAYSGLGASSFGTRALVKDLAALIAPNAFGQGKA